MKKTETTWLNTVKDELKKAGKGTSMKTALPLAKKVWDLIKSGKHPTKMQATKATTAKRSRRKSKSSKKSKSSRKKRKSKKRRRKR